MKKVQDPTESVNLPEAEKSTFLKDLSLRSKCTAGLILETISSVDCKDCFV
jgi:hypothetical protein